jgi:hypothetical protein
MLTELFWQIFINYPPTVEQLGLGISSPASLWALRLLSLIFLISTTFFFSSGLPAKVKRYYWILVFACPAFSLIWMAYPVEALALFIISAVFYLLSRKNKNYLAATAVSAIVIVVLNLGVFKQNPNILNILSLKGPQEEVNFRFQVEDNLNPNIGIPRLLKRAVYNKFFFALREVSSESLTFFDFETLFFQEVHPLGQKAFVVFFWPEILIFCLGLRLAVKKLISAKKLVPLLVLSFAYFITSGISNERRLILTLFPLSILIAESIHFCLGSRSKKIKVGIILLIALTLYGWATNYFDRYIRPSYWLDNRPMAYTFILSYLKGDNRKYDQIVVSNTLYALKDYCRYYLKRCPDFVYEDFNLLRQPVMKNTLYIGFVGNFLGPNTENSFPANPDSEINKKGLEILQETHIVNNIANGFGQDLLIVRTKYQ